MFVQTAGREIVMQDEAEARLVALLGRRLGLPGAGDRTNLSSLTSGTSSSLTASAPSSLTSGAALAEEQQRTALLQARLTAGQAAYQRLQRENVALKEQLSASQRRMRSAERMRNDVRRDLQRLGQDTNAHPTIDREALSMSQGCARGLRALAICQCRH